MKDIRNMMWIEEELEGIDQLIEKDLLHEAVKRLEMFKAFTFKSFSTSLSGLRGQINAAEKDEMEGLVSREDARVRRAQIRKGITMLAAKLPEDMALFVRTNRTNSYFDTLGAVDDLEKLVSDRSHMKGIQWLAKGLEAAKSVCLIESGCMGTGFVVGDGYLMTCAHVLPNADAAGKAVLKFQVCGKTGQSETQVFALDKASYLSSSHLDYAIARIVSPQGHNIPASLDINLHFDPQASYSDTLLMVLQHPMGNEMQLGIETNGILKIDPPHLYHCVNTQPGSSGAPILDHNWEVIALHQAGQGKEEGGYPIGRSGNKIPANKGTLINVIIADCEKNYSENVDW